jgi:hypothetical protein
MFTPKKSIISRISLSKKLKKYIFGFRLGGVGGEGRGGRTLLSRPIVFVD